MNNNYFISFPELNSSPFDNYLKNNEPPTPLELAQLQELRRTAAEEDVHIEDLFDALHARRAALQSYRHKLSKALALFRKLPSDVLTIVFGFIPECCWELSWVCRAWRGVVLSMPSMWAIVPDIGYPVKSATRFLRCIDIHRSRAGSRPLNVRYLSLPLKFGFTHEDFQKFLCLFQELIPRIGVLKIDVGKSWRLADLSLLTMFPQTFDCLDALHVNFEEPKDDTPPGKPMTIFKNMHNMSRMTFAFPAMDNWPPLFEWLDLPWANFRSLELGWITCADVYHMLQYSPRLKKLAVVVNTIYTQEQFPPSKFSHSQISSPGLSFLCGH